MNFLQLSKRLRSEAGLSGSGPTTVIGQSGEMEQVVNWVATAYDDILSMHPDWKFAQTSFNFSTIVGIDSYTPVSVSITDLSQWLTSDFRVYYSASDEVFLVYEPWENFRSGYQYGSMRTQTGKPTVVSIKPDDTLVFWPTPDKIYTVDGQYFKILSSLSLDGDTPAFKSTYHMAVVWRALMMFGAYTGAPDLYAHGEKEFKTLSRKLELNQLPRILFGAPLA